MPAVSEFILALRAHGRPIDGRKAGHTFPGAEERLCFEAVGDTRKILFSLKQHPVQHLHSPRSILSDITAVSSLHPVRANLMIRRALFSSQGTTR